MYISIYISIYVYVYVVDSTLYTSWLITKTKNVTLLKNDCLYKNDMTIFANNVCKRYCY